MIAGANSWWRDPQVKLLLLTGGQGSLGVSWCTR
uniref:Uncharacterized protein n=1 Tax=Brassica oleracea TaxID=3712 RepID=A0A3P6D689_BRAOL|nr:unnamed protein product [Brassica oleracea]